MYLTVSCVDVFVCWISVFLLRRRAGIHYTPHTHTHTHTHRFSRHFLVAVTWRHVRIAGRTEQ